MTFSLAKMCIRDRSHSTRSPSRERRAAHGEARGSACPKHVGRACRRSAPPPLQAASDVGLPRAGVGPCRFSDIAPAGHAPWYNGRMTDQTQITLTAPESVNMALVVGQADELLHLVQDAFSARITVRGDTIVLEGDPTEVQSLTALFSDLIKVAEAREEPTPDYVRRAIDLLTSAEFSPCLLYTSRCV